MLAWIVVALAIFTPSACGEDATANAQLKTSREEFRSFQGRIEELFRQHTLSFDATFPDACLASMSAFQDAIDEGYFLVNRMMVSIERFEGQIKTAATDEDIGRLTSKLTANVAEFIPELRVVVKTQMKAHNNMVRYLQQIPRKSTAFPPWLRSALEVTTSVLDGTKAILEAAERAEAAVLLSVLSALHKALTKSEVCRLKYSFSFINTMY